MKLKKLEISGFKSFVDKTAISFPEGISAIVGPNGCGKSNVVDAIRWVMGEQSVKQLRGKSMEDIIFSGAQSKAPVNLAEVSLTLINDNGSAPEELKDLSEIQITRRLFRSGERAYYINKQPCRLKDINNIFLGSGMGSRSYAVIQQGNIGAITDAGPEERRFFIEEAAGITRYKQRKEEALQKVKSTKDNLLRVTDIINEVKRQMASLKRQAKKAEQYKTFRSRIKDLDITLSIIEYDDYKQQIETNRSVLLAMGDDESRVTATLTTLDAKVSDVKLTLTQKNQEISGQKSRKFETQRHMDKLENDLKHLKQEIARLDTEIVKLTTMKNDLDAKNKSVAEEIVEVEKQNEEINVALKSKQALLEVETKQTKELNDALRELNQQLDTHKTHLMQLVADEAKYKNMHKNASETKENIQRRLKRIAEDIMLSERNVTESSTAEVHARKTLTDIKNYSEEIDRQIKKLQQQLDEKKHQLSEKVKKIQAIESERNTLSSRYNALKKMDDDFEWYKDGVKAIMKNNHPAPGSIGSTLETGYNPEQILGVMADIVTPEPGFEMAVEVALGESLQYIIVSDQNTGLSAIDYLYKSNAGRSGFIPLSSLASKNGQDYEYGTSDVFAIEYLTEHITIQKGFEALAQGMLADVAVTDTLDDALTLWNLYNSQNGHTPLTIVTKDGAVISGKGIMTGGSKDKLSGILAKKKEIKELHGAITATEQKLEAERALQVELFAAVRDDEMDVHDLTDQKSDLSRQEIDAQKKVYKIAEELKHAQRQLETVSVEEDRLLSREADIDTEIIKSEEAVTRIENDTADAQNHVSLVTEKINALSAQMEGFQQKIVDIRLELTSMTTQFENSRNNLKRLKTFLEDGLRRFEDVTVDIERKIERSAQTKEKIKQDGESLTGLYEEYQNVCELLEKNETAYQAIETELKRHEEEIAVLQRKKISLQEKYRKLDMEQSQRQLKLENIVSRIEERYHHPFDIQMDQYRDTVNSLEISKDSMLKELAELKEKTAKIGDVNLGAIEEYEELKTRYDFLNSQNEDLENALEDLYKVIRKTNKISKEMFLKTFNEINTKMAEVFPKLFGGGKSELVLTEPENPLESGVEMMIQPPGKKLTRLSLLSGGEKALSAIAFIFAIFLIKPASFCLMDEIDAPLDEANVLRFNELVKIIGEKSQIVMVTHNKRSMEFAEKLVGVTMQKKGISQIVSVNLDG